MESTSGTPAKRIYGIDLGTTYSCISYIDESGKPVIAKNLEGDLTTPSVVHFESRENIVVGKPAKNTCKIDPERVSTFIKRSMGDSSFSLEANGETYTPETISSFILRKIVNDAENEVGDKITDVVITCPAYFGNSEREATKNAGRLAGLNVHEILNEPTAAALCYGAANSDRDQVVLVYDLGGGTFDITVIAIRGGDIEVVCTGGDHKLGGKEWDDAVISFFADEFMRQNPSAGDPRDDTYALQDLITAAEEAKKGLTGREKWPQAVAYNGQRARVELTREKFDELTVDLLERTLEMTRSTLKVAADQGFPKMDQILLVGGSSKMPCVARRIKEQLGLEPQLFEPDLSVAKGAALRGAMINAGQLLREKIRQRSGAAAVDLDSVDEQTLKKAASEVAQAGGGRVTAAELLRQAKRVVRNVTSKGYGVVATENGNDYVSFVLHQNEKLPLERTQPYGTAVENQTGLHLVVMEQTGQTESRELADNRQVGEAEMSGFPPNLPRGSRIEVTFILREDGTLDVAALEKVSGKVLEINLKVSGVMTDEEIESKRSGLMALNVS